jgi:ubiquinone/menaquinone biosynthesis C-methylase UbiE
MSNETDELRDLIKGMRAAYGRGENVMAYARDRMSDGAAPKGNSLAATLIAYDLQAGVYSADALAAPDLQDKWCEQLAGLVGSQLPSAGSVLEVGVGEATTLAGVLGALQSQVGAAYGFDVSWSRVVAGSDWLAKYGQRAELFVGDLFQIPLADNSIDVVYSSHSLEPNGGREEAAIAECLRVARRAVVLVEPIYELVTDEARARMDRHGYVRGLRDTAIRLGAIVADYRLLDICHNPLNPSGVVLLVKQQSASMQKSDAISKLWRCPLTGTALERDEDCFIAADMGIAYPVLRGVPLLRPEHAVLASRLTAKK